MHRLHVPGGTAPAPGLDGTPGPPGGPCCTGAPGGWHATSTGRAGYVADRLAWRRGRAGYQAAVTLSATGPVNMEVWDNTGNVLLARQSLPRTDGIQTVTLGVAARNFPNFLYGGWGPFLAKFGGGPKTQQIEARVWTPGGSTVNVYSAQLTRA